MVQISAIFRACTLAVAAVNAIPINQRDVTLDVQGTNLLRELFPLERRALALWPRSNCGSCGQPGHSQQNCPQGQPTGRGAVQPVRATTPPEIHVAQQTLNSASRALDQARQSHGPDSQEARSARQALTQALTNMRNARNLYGDGQTNSQANSQGRVTGDVGPGERASGSGSHSARRRG